MPRLVCLNILVCMETLEAENLVSEVQVIKLADFNFQYLMIERQYCIEGLGLRRFRDSSF